MIKNLSIIVAYDRNMAIGKDNTIPWRLSSDMKHFKELTMGKTIIMGRKTFASLNYKLLPGRTSVVVSSDPSLSDKYGPEVYPSLDAAIKAHDTETEVMIIGGGRLYHSALPLVYKIYATEVDTEIKDADTFFPLIPSEFVKISSESYGIDEKNQYPYTFVSYERDIR